ncbi:helix-turn-helix domain-containing protein [Pigmentiphaga kullae]|uniref:Helix-turn-helix protein n=1 Tax=Pigmentiphaga kullae TaxID=151784 RepID=A0A4Q7ND90_9BURK|nr:helix-turn-helix domain-containing protein [Pigmentiphaga kullae]RZS80637.1 helix-turn-helix protein [Pigmentiphaga kullae]
MSTVVMSAVWPLQGMTPAQKAVLVSLADNANDEGVCWPSVATIVMRTCLSERAVQVAIKWLVQAQALGVRQRDGRSTVYQVTPAAYAPPQEMHPRKSRTPAANAPTPADAAPPPPQQVHPTPADAAPRTVKEPKREPSKEPPLPSGPGKPPRAGKRPPDESVEAFKEACRATWGSYAAAYEDRYDIAPVRNAKTNAGVAQLVKRLGASEAPQVAAWFLTVKEPFVVNAMHDLGQLLNRAEAYRTQWATGRAAPAASKGGGHQSEAWNHDMDDALARAQAGTGRAAAATGEVIDV